MSTIWIDGQSFEVDSSKNLLEVILSLGFDLPYFCWHPALGSVGSCRQCAIKKYGGEDESQGQIVMACMEPALDGLHLSVQDQEASDFREHVIEWLMLNHPHDCPICDEGGECHLQDMTVMAGHSYRRSRFKKRTYNNQNLGPCINHEMNRCIQCYRCVRFYNDFAGGDDLQVFSAHDHVYFGRHQEGTLESEFSGNLVEVCPTGVFTDKTLKEHYTRKWDLTSAPSVCQQCSLGCNILAGERYGSLRRILSRYNSEVNGYFICDRGRFGYEFVNGVERIRQSFAVSNNQRTALDPASVTDQLSAKLGSGSLMGIGSPRASLESNYLLRELVGEDNFYNGLDGLENEMLQLALQHLNNGPLRTPSLKEVEYCDAVIVIGEDLTNTAPMLDLAVNQSVRVQPLKQISKVGIADWNDAAVREHLQQEKGPLYLLTPQETKLDRLATKCYREAPEMLARLVMAIAQELDNSINSQGDLGDENQGIKEIAKALAGAERPLIITGSSIGSLELLTAAINLSTALHKVNHETSISFVFGESNTMGVGMLHPKSLSDAVTQENQHETLVILENDLFRRHTEVCLNQFLSGFKNIMVLDHTESRVIAKADLILAAGTFAESDGTLVNQEGRAQRFFQVQSSDEAVQESWRWLIQAGKLLGKDRFSGLNTLDDVIASIESALPQFKGISGAALPAHHRIHSQKMTRQPHRYSGRTSMFAQHSVNEPRPPKDPDSPLSFTMEGYSGIPPESTTSFYWSPGWNSAQAINKFRNEITHGREESHPGVRLIEPSSDRLAGYLSSNNGQSTGDGDWKLIPIHNIFGSEELSMKSAALAERSPAPCITMNEADADRLNMTDGDAVQLTIQKQSLSLPIQTESSWPAGYLGIPAGYPDIPFLENSSDINVSKLTQE